MLPLPLLVDYFKIQFMQHFFSRLNSYRYHLVKPGLQVQTDKPEWTQLLNAMMMTYISLLPA
jgi:hypothetical protein